MPRPASLTLVLAALCLGSAADAQFRLPGGSTTNGTTTGGIGGLLGGAMPNVASVGAGNAAGVLSYCIRNNYLSGANASSVLGRLTGRQGVTGSSGYAVGRSGTLQTGRNTLSLSSLRDQVKTRVCSLVLRQGTSLLDR